MSDHQLTADTDYQNLLATISNIYSAGQVRAYQAVNTQLTATYWQIGHDIVEFEQGGQARADYGKALLKNLSRDLTLRHGKGFSRSNMIYMRLLYLQYPIGQKPSDLLSWSHHVELLRIGIILTRNKDELLVEYATYQMNSQLFVQKYQLYLPEREELRRELELTLQIAEAQARSETP